MIGSRTGGKVITMDAHSHDDQRHDPQVARVLRAIAVAFVLVAVAASCGSNGDQGSPQPGGPDEPAEQGSVSFTGLPQYDGATPIGEPNVEGSTTTQTFTVDRVSPQEILEFYGRKLGDWDVVEKPHALSDGSQAAWRGEWSSGDRTLLVSAEKTPSENQEGTQYSLNLRRT